MPKVQTHQIQVQTEEEQVTVMIGGDGGVPGGFAKFFNRVIDSLAWANLPDAAKAAYMVLVRFADHRNHFRVQLGQATLMKYAGLSRSSIKRALKDLLSSKLLVLVEQGGVTQEGQNESNLYQLMIPSEGKSRQSRSALGSSDSPSVSPLGVRQRTPSRFTSEPPAGPQVIPLPVQRQTGAGAQSDRSGGFAPGPQLRRIDKEELEDNNRACDSDRGTRDGDAAVLLEEKGVEPTVARCLAAEYPHERIIDVIATMEYRRARGKCDNPGGFIRDALVRKWPTPRAVIEARKQAEARLRAQAAEADARRQRAIEGSQVGDEERRVQQVIDQLDDDELHILAESILKKYQDNSAVLTVLTRRPPRQCRLMKMEIAALLGRTVGAR